MDRSRITEFFLFTSNPNSILWISDYYKCIKETKCHMIDPYCHKHVTLKT